MKLVDILARDLGFWPDGMGAACQMEDGRLVFSREGTKVTVENTSWYISDANFGCKSRQFGLSENFFDAIVTRDEWQAAVDALNQSELDAVLAKNEQLAAARAERIPAWNGEGLPPVGAICEYDARPVGRGDPLFVTVKVKYVSDQSIVIICTDVPDGENKENIGVELALMNGISMLGKFRAIRTAEQVAAEEREKAIEDMLSLFEVAACKQTYDMRGGIAAIYDANYRNKVAK